ncbi:hypothetical protein NL676_023819, partial [Syzygium grande]
MRATNFCPKNLVILDLSNSSIDEHWGGWTQLKVATRLKVLDLSRNCNKLHSVGQLPSSLREFIVYDCGSLEVVDLSDLSNFKKLTVFRGCPKLVEIQGLDKLESLEILYIGGLSSKAYRSTTEKRIDLVIRRLALGKHTIITIRMSSLDEQDEHTYRAIQSVRIQGTEYDVGNEDFDEHRT